MPSNFRPAPPDPVEAFVRRVQRGVTFPQDVDPRLDGPARLHYLTDQRARAMSDQAPVKKAAALPQAKADPTGQEAKLRRLAALYRQRGGGQMLPMTSVASMAPAAAVRKAAKPTFVACFDSKGQLVGAVDQAKLRKTAKNGDVAQINAQGQIIGYANPEDLVPLKASPSATKKPASAKPSTSPAVAAQQRDQEVSQARADGHAAAAALPVRKAFKPTPAPALPDVQLEARLRREIADRVKTAVDEALAGADDELQEVKKRLAAMEQAPRAGFFIRPIAERPAGR